MRKEWRVRVNAQTQICTRIKDDAIHLFWKFCDENKHRKGAVVDLYDATDKEILFVHTVE